MKTMKQLLDSCSSRTRLLAVSVLLLASVGTQAADQEPIQILRGTLQQLRQDDGYLVISGKQVKFSHGETEVLLNGVQQNAAVLDEGMVVRYTLNAAGVITKIEILGPLDKIRILTDN